MKKKISRLVMAVLAMALLSVGAGAARPADAMEFLKTSKESTGTVTRERRKQFTFSRSGRSSHSTKRLSFRYLPMTGKPSKAARALAWKGFIPWKRPGPFTVSV